MIYRKVNSARQVRLGLRKRLGRFFSFAEQIALLIFVTHATRSAARFLFWYLIALVVMWYHWAADL